MKECSVCAAGAASTVRYLRPNVFLARGVVMTLVPLLITEKRYPLSWTVYGPWKWPLQVRESIC